MAMKQLSFNTDPQTTKSSVVVYLSLPAISRISNLHVWAIFCARKLFAEQPLQVNFIKKVQPEWDKYTDLLEFLYKFMRTCQPLKVLLSAPLELSDNHDELIDYGAELEESYRDLKMEIKMIADQFLAEFELSKLGKRTEDTFDLWYSENFEETSPVHREAVRNAALKKSKLCDVSLLLMLIPHREKILVSIPTTILPAACQKHIWNFNVVKGDIECFHCGQPMPEGEMIGY